MRWTKGNWYRGITDERFTTLVYAARERVFRELVYQRDQGLCVLCGLPVSLESMDLDHRQPRILGGSDEASNMQVTHPACNSRKCGKRPEDADYASFCDTSVASEDIITISQAAVQLDLHTVTIYQAIRAGKIRILTYIDGRKMLSRQDVNAYRPDRTKQKRKV